MFTIMMLWKKRIANNDLAVKFTRPLTNDYAQNRTVKNPDQKAI